MKRESKEATHHAHHIAERPFEWRMERISSSQGFKFEKKTFSNLTQDTHVSQVKEVTECKINISRQKNHQTHTHHIWNVKLYPHEESNCVRVFVQLLFYGLVHVNPLETSLFSGE